MGVKKERYKGIHPPPKKEEWEEEVERDGRRR